MHAHADAGSTVEPAGQQHTFQPREANVLQRRPGAAASASFIKSSKRPQQSAACAHARRHLASDGRWRDKVQLLPSAYDTGPGIGEYLPTPPQALHHAGLQLHPGQINGSTCDGGFKPRSYLHEKPKRPLLPEQAALIGWLDKRQQLRSEVARFHRMQHPVTAAEVAEVQVAEHAKADTTALTLMRDLCSSAVTLRADPGRTMLRPHSSPSLCGPSPHEPVRYSTVHPLQGLGLHIAPDSSAASSGSLDRFRCSSGILQSASSFRPAVWRSAGHLERFAPTMCASDAAASMQAHHRPSSSSANRCNSIAIGQLIDDGNYAGDDDVQALMNRRHTNRIRTGKADGSSYAGSTRGTVRGTSSAAAHIHAHVPPRSATKSQRRPRARSPPSGAVERRCTELYLLTVC